MINRFAIQFLYYPINILIHWNVNPHLKKSSVEILLELDQILLCNLGNYFSLETNPNSGVSSISSMHIQTRQ